MYAMSFLTFWLWEAYKSSSFLPFWKWSAVGYSIVTIIGVTLELAAIEHENNEHLRRVLSRISVAVVVLGLSGEVVCGIQYEGLSDQIISELNTELSLASSRTSLAINKAADATTQAGDAKSSAEYAANAAASAESSANAAKREADTVIKDVASAEEHLARVQAFLTPRSLTQKEMDELRDSLKAIAATAPDTPIVVIS
jgi:hypothetical protein